MPAATAVDDDPYHGIVPNPNRKRNPLVLVGALATGGVLATGLIAFRNGNQKLSQSMMRWRVTAQAVTVGIMLASAGGAAAAQAWGGVLGGGEAGADK